MGQLVPPTVALVGDGPAADLHCTVLRSLGCTVERRAGDALEAGVPATSDPATSVVVVANQPSRRAETALTALQRHAAVVLEPPLCSTLVEAGRLVAAGRTEPHAVVYGEPVVQAPTVRHALSLLPRVGSLTYLEAHALAVGEPSSTPDWALDTLSSLALHPIALVLLTASAAGHGRPGSVWVNTSAASNPGRSTVELRLRYRTGLTAQVTAGWLHRGEPHWDLQIAGDKGVVRAELLPAPRLELNGEAVHLPMSEVSAPPERRMGTVAMWHTTLDDLQHRRAPLLGAEFGREVLEVVFAAAESTCDAREAAVPFTGDRSLSLSQVWHRG